MTVEPGWRERVTDWLPEVGGAAAADKLLLSVATVAVLLLLRWAIVRMLERRTTELAATYRWRRFTLYVAASAIVIALGFIWFREFRSLATFFGLLTAGLAIALRDIVTSFAGWIFILVRKPFELGDRIQIGDHAGDVIDLRIFKFSLMEIGNWVDADQSTGRVIHVPNSDVLTESIVNYTRGFPFIWNEIAVVVTFESDWRDAKAILQEIVDREAGDIGDRALEALRTAAKRFMLYYRKVTPIVYTDVKENGVALTIRHLCAPRERRGVSERIWEAILVAFADRADIDFAYPTQRFYDNRMESKEARTLSGPEGGDRG